MLDKEVRSVRLEGLPWPPGSPLRNHPVKLNDDDTLFKAAAFDGRSIITSKDDQMAFEV